MNYRNFAFVFLGTALVSCNSSGGGGGIVLFPSTSGIESTEMAGVIGGSFESLGGTDFGSSGVRRSKSYLSQKGIKLNTRFTPEEQSSEDPNCSNKGRPWDSQLDQAMSENDTEYSNLRFRCLATINSNSPETVRGVLAQAAELSCALEAITGQPVSFPSTVGDNEVPFSNADLTTTGCFADTSEMPTNVSGTVTYTTLNSQNNGFEEKIKIEIDDMDPNTVGDQPFEYSMFFFNEDNRMGIKTVEEAEGLDGAGGSAQVLVDLNENVIFFNYIDDRARNGEDYRTLVRLKMNATFDANFNITAVSEGTGFSLNSGPNKNESYSGATITGSQTTGFKSRAFYYFNDPAPTIQPRSMNCIDGLCDGMDGLYPVDETEAENVFMDNQTTWSNFILGTGTLCAEDDVTLAAVPSTGSLGVCLAR